MVLAYDVLFQNPSTGNEQVSGFSFIILSVVEGGSTCTIGTPPDACAALVYWVIARSTDTASCEQCTNAAYSSLFWCNQFTVPGIVSKCISVIGTLRRTGEAEEEGPYIPKCSSSQPTSPVGKQWRDDAEKHLRVRPPPRRPPRTRFPCSGVVI